MHSIIKFTHNSLSTMIAWVSTCLLAGGVSTFFNASSRMIWMSWGCFGLASAVGLDIAARIRERMRNVELNRIATSRFERELQYAAEENEANTAIREAVSRVLGKSPAALQRAACRRTQERFPCDLEVELFLHRGLPGAAGNRGTGSRIARITNLSDLGFEMTLTDRLPTHQITMIIAAANGGRLTMLGEVLWCGPQPDGSFLAGGRFLSVVSGNGN